jgi:octaprenyl-diphosphate synthase
VKKNDYIKKLQEFVGDDLEQMDVQINSLIIGKEHLISTLSNHLISSGGKKLRPILTIICSKLCGYIGTRHINLAAAVEFIHTATLLHDDVVDQSSLRRGSPTANNKWGNKAPILVGDFLLSQAFKLMVKDGSLKILDVLSSASAIIAEGEVMQLSATNNIEITEQKYIEIISAKTAALFAAACQIGPIITGLSEEKQQSLYNFGNYLGIAFQMIDDALDFSAKEQELGKSIGDDFKEGKVTLPVIIACSKASIEEKLFFNRTMHQMIQTSEDLELAINIINKYQAFDYVINQAKNYINLAREQLKDFADCTAKNMLLDILDFSINRSY